jgi:hypothetical protein
MEQSDSRGDRSGYACAPRSLASRASRRPVSARPYDYLGWR